MARVDLTYARALLRAAPLPDIARAALRRGERALRRRPPAPAVSVEDAMAAADALGRAPRLFTTEPLDEHYLEHELAALTRFRLRAAAILGNEVELGRTVKLPPRLDWHADPLTGHRFDPQAPSATMPLGGDGIDPKWLWELGRAGHLVELGAACRVYSPVEGRARVAIQRHIESFLDQNRVGRGMHYASALEVALRSIHWLAAVELAGGARAFPRPFVERLGGALLEEARFLAGHLEDSGVVPANHLLADHVGLYILGLALDGAPGARAWAELGRQGVRREAARQVGPDGAHFEASTGYHRFAVELLLAAHLAARGAGEALGVGETLHHMLEYVRGYLTPDGREPAIGDGDDARVLPVVPRDPRDHHHLLSIGVALFGDPALRPIGGRLAEEALWLGGPAAQATWDWVPPVADLKSVSFPSGGLHVLRSRRTYVALRSGSYGQRGVGGHAHNDQLSVVVHADGKPLIVDPGTGSYSSDPVVRDRFRGTAAHATVVVDSAEQSPILPGRPFALLDCARAGRVLLEDSGPVAELTGEHSGYLRLPGRVLHRRRVALHRELELLLIEDQLLGHGESAVDVRFPLGPGVKALRIGASKAARERVAALPGELGTFDLDRAVEIGGDTPVAVLLPLASSPLQPSLTEGFFSPRYGTVERQSLVSFSARLNVPCTTTVGILVLD